MNGAEFKSLRESKGLTLKQVQTYMGITMKALQWIEDHPEVKLNQKFDPGIRRIKDA